MMVRVVIIHPSTPRHNPPDPVYSTQQAMVKEIELKVWVYNLMLGLALAPALSAAGS
jgi:hypothetical protein